MKTLIFTLLISTISLNAQDKSDSFSLIYLFSAGDIVHVTGNLTHYWDDDDVSSGAVTSWVDQIASLDMAQGTEAKQPTKGATGIVYDGGDYLLGNAFTVPTDISLEMVIKFGDVTSFSMVFLVEDDAGVTYVSFCSLSDIYRFRHKIDGSFQVDFGFSSVGLGDLIHVVFTSDGTTTKMYINGVSKTTTGDTGVQPDIVETAFGGRTSGGSAVPANGTIYRLVRVYDDVLTPDEVLQNYNSVSTQGKF